MPFLIARKMSAESCKMKRSIITTDQTTDFIVTAIALGTVIALAAFGFMVALALPPI